MIGKIEWKELDAIDCQCGEVVILAEAPIFAGPKKGKITQLKIGCKCEDIQLAKEAWAIHERAMSEKAMERFELHSLIPPKLKTASFENFQPQNKGQAKAMQRLQEYAEHFDPTGGNNILLTGDYGTGKSHLTVAAIFNILERGHSAIFVDLPQLFTKIKASFKKDSEVSEEEILEALKKVDILVLDDLGAESMTDWRKETLLQLINARAGKCTLYTSNLTSEEIFEHIGQRNFSRLFAETEVFKITGKDMRMYKRKQAEDNQDAS